MKEHAKAEKKLRSFSNSVVDGDERSASRDRQLYPVERSLLEHTEQKAGRNP
jgi:hypothetical protein